MQKTKFLEHTMNDPLQAYQGMENLDRRLLMNAELHALRVNDEI